MIRLFRKIRHRLLSENRYSIYILYATGEIVLVVIGILLALQIDNGVDERKNVQREQELLTDLLDNLEINVSQLKEDLEWDSLAINSGAYILKAFQSKLEYSDSIDKHFHNSRLVPNPFLTSSAYQAIENKGFEIISSKNLRKNVIKLFDDTYPSMILEINNIDENILKPKMQTYMIDHFEYVGSLKPNDYEKLIHDQLYINILTFNIEIQSYFMSLRLECLSNTELLIEEVVSELK